MSQNAQELVMASSYCWGALKSMTNRPSLYGMLPVTLKTQNALTVRFPLQTADSKPPKNSLSTIAGKPVYSGQDVAKSSGAMQHSTRLFSPYLGPSAVHAENKQISQSSMAPIYQQNIAITKYYNISVIPKPRNHLSTNLVA